MDFPQLQLDPRQMATQMSLPPFLPRHEPIYRWCSMPVSVTVLIVVVVAVAGERREKRCPQFVGNSECYVVVMVVVVVVWLRA